MLDRDRITIAFIRSMPASVVLSFGTNGVGSRVRTLKHPWLSDPRLRGGWLSQIVRTSRTLWRVANEKVVCSVQLSLATQYASSADQPVNSAGAWMPEGCLPSGIHAPRIDRRHPLLSASTACISSFPLGCSNVVAGSSAA